MGGCPPSCRPRGEQGRAGGGARLPGRVARERGSARRGEQGDHGRAGHRHRAVRSGDHAAAEGDGGADHLLDPERPALRTRPRRRRWRRAHRPRGSAPTPPTPWASPRRARAGRTRERPLAHPLVEVGRGQQPPDVGPAGARRRRRPRRRRAWRRNRCGAPAPGEPDRLDADGVDSGLDRGEVGPGVEQGPEEHVAAGPGPGVDPGQPALIRPRHRGAAACDACRVHSAPKPLSMLTTTTPGAQELSIASRAATPPNEAP